MSFYASVLAPLFFTLDAERAHRLALFALQLGIYPRFAKNLDPILRSHLWGIQFPTPIGMAAGFDKNAVVFKALLDLGFGFVETGTVTPIAQAGNHKPRVFRLTDDRAVINRLGFNNDGYEAFLWNLKKWLHRKKQMVIGVNIGKNKNTQNEIGDFVAGILTFADYANYLVINVSSPNTPGLRDLQSKDNLTRLLLAAIQARNSCKSKPPLLVKLAPDLSESERSDIADVVIETRIDGIIISNTTIQRPEGLKAKNSAQIGGLSGKPLFDMSTQLLSEMYELTRGDIPLIGVGGVTNGLDAYKKLRAGASLVQLYTAFIFEGPRIALDASNELAQLVKDGGYREISEIIGLDHKC